MNKYKVSNFHNKNQFVIETDNEYIFQSYNSTCAFVTKDNNELWVCLDYVDYSKTTSKHLRMFINEYSQYSIPTDTTLKKWALCKAKQGTIKVFNK